MEVVVQGIADAAHVQIGPDLRDEEVLEQGRRRRRRRGELAYRNAVAVLDAASSRIAWIGRHEREPVGLPDRVCRTIVERIIDLVRAGLKRLGWEVERCDDRAVACQIVVGDGGDSAAGRAARNPRVGDTGGVEPCNREDGRRCRRRLECRPPREVEGTGRPE